MRFRDRDLHFVVGPSAAGTLHRLGMAWRNMCLAEDDFSCGPLLSLEDLDRFRRLRREFWRTKGDTSAVDLQDQDIPFIPLIALDRSSRRLRSADHIFLWLGTTLQEQLVLAWVVSLFKILEFDAGAVRLLELQSPKPNVDRSIRLLNGESIRQKVAWRHPAGKELASYESAWRAVSAPSPLELIDICATGSQHPEALVLALQALLARYPAKVTGLSHWDRAILAHCGEKSLKAARIIGHTIAYDLRYPDWPGDLYLFDRLKRLGDSRLAHPLLTLTGDRSAMRFTEAAITETGRKVLAGEANHVVLNGVNDWVGGVHLKARRGCPWLFDGETLVPGDTA